MRIFMKKDKKDQRNQQSESNSDQPLTGKKRENPTKRPRIPRPDKPATPPEKPVQDPEPIRPVPGVSEPEKNDPTRIDDPPPIFNTK